MEQKIIETKQDWAWSFIYYYLYFLDSLATPPADEVYKKLLSDLRAYVAKKIEVDGEIIDYYITVLHTQED